jgi:hypothetical protein
MPPGGTTEDENVEPGRFEAISRWLSPSTADDTTGGYDPKPVHPGRGASPWGSENWSGGKPPRPELVDLLEGFAVEHDVKFLDFGSIQRPLRGSLLISASFRGYRFAQPPANGLHPSGMT